ncbi:MAG: cytochrome c3 family protein [Deltaproteobacteria bacterium]|nr:cytochrome c3 family protein [Deltaproteobacteria bacterium]
MKKKYLILVIILIVGGILYLPVRAVMAADVPDTIKMESKVYPKHTKSIVTFPHKKHAVDKKIACTECHHVFEDGKNVWKEGDEVKKCDACHSETKKPSDLKVSKAENIKRFHYTAIHANCRGCHSDLKKKNEATGPTTCNDCHKK